MKYVKQHFVTGMKVSLPDVLNRMEDGIAAAWRGGGGHRQRDHRRHTRRRHPGRQALPDSAAR